MNPRMKPHHRDQLLVALMHYLPMDIRAKIMLEVPAAYNDFYGKTYLVVCSQETGEPVMREDTGDTASRLDTASHLDKRTLAK